MKERPILFSPPMVHAIVERAKTVTRRVADYVPEWVATIRTERGEAVFTSHNADRIERTRCPYGVPGDGLWVREAWSTPPGFGDWRTTPRSAIRYSSTSEVLEGWKRRHARFMPRCYARITLDVVSARVERLLDITSEDARHEGVNGRLTRDCAAGEPTARERFAELWDAINGDTAPWSSDPWVWRVEFKVVEVRHG